ncbi:MAG: hypothetical protein R3C05_08945 [Pirellulaceae bacterium]
MVRWPGRTPAGTVSDQLIELTDFIATCAAIVGTSLPAGVAEDSRNILPALLNPDPDQDVREVSVHHSLWGNFAIREGDWKMIPERGSGGFTVPRSLDADKIGGPQDSCITWGMTPRKRRTYGTIILMSLSGLRLD